MTGFTQLYPLFSSTRMKRYWLLNDLFVNENHRGKGHSKALIESAKELCRETKACGILLETDKTNEIGNNFIQVVVLSIILTPIFMNGLILFNV